MTEEIDQPEGFGKLLVMAQFNGVVYVAMEYGLFYVVDGVLKQVPFHTPLSQPAPSVPAHKAAGGKNAKG